MSKNILVVGAGFFGATAARLLAEKGHWVTVIEKESYVGGHASTKVRDGVITSDFGPHIFHTSSDEVWNFVNRFAEFKPFSLRTKVNYKGKVYTFPITIKTISEVLADGKYLTPEEAKGLVAKDIVPCDSPKNFEEAALATVGRKLYEVFFYGYTKKQWGCEPRELPVEIFSRIPIRYTYDDSYFQKHRNKYQGIPLGGYSTLIELMLNHQNISLHLNILDWRKWVYEDYDQWDLIVYTGPLDLFFDCQYGKLPYRSLRFQWERHEGDFQGNAIINYSDQTIPYTRITQYDKFEDIDLGHSVIAKEYPASYEETEVPFYPVNTREGQDTYLKYKELADQLAPKVIFGGRLAEFRYYDMDEVCFKAIKLAEQL